MFGIQRMGITKKQALPPLQENYRASNIVTAVGLSKAPCVPDGARHCPSGGTASSLPPLQEVRAGRHRRTHSASPHAVSFHSTNTRRRVVVRTLFSL